jgi:hypothetical protein
MKISNPTELISYIQKNFTSLTDEQYFKLLNNTLKVYPMNKPTNVYEAILTIKEMANLPITNRPLFI